MVEVTSTCIPFNVNPSNFNLILHFRLDRLNMAAVTRSLVGPQLSELLNKVGLCALAGGCLLIPR